MADILTVEDVRQFMFDRTIQDNELEMDLSFEDNDILEAMKRAARDANSIPPYSASWTADCLPNDTNIFLYATAEQLYMSGLQRLMRNDTEYTAGGVTGSTSKARIQHYGGLIKQMFGPGGTYDWRDQLKRIKITKNIRQMHFYG